MSLEMPKQQREEQIMKTPKLECTITTWDKDLFNLIVEDATSTGFAIDKAKLLHEVHREGI